ncbi:MAG: MG2 domain-containing protein [Thiolinea sp.]
MGLRQLFKSLLALISVLILLSANVVCAEEQHAFKATAYTNQQLLSEMLLVDASEQTLDKAPALVVTFSQDLDTNIEYSEFFTTTQAGKAVEGKWVIVNNPRRLYFTQVQANTSYRIQLRPGIAAKNGLKLLKPVDFELKTREIQPAFDFASKGSLIPLQSANGLPIRVVNVQELDVEFLRVQPEKLGDVLKAIRLDNSLQSWELEEIHSVTSSVYTTRYPTNAKPNARETFILPITQIEALKQPGLYFAVIRQPGRFTDKAYRITHFVVTNIGLQARVYKKKLEVFAHALDSGKPLHGVKVEVKAIDATTKAITNEQGQASFAAYPAKSFFITASTDNQFAFLDLSSSPLDLSRLPIKGLPEKDTAPYIYASHALYRPGDTVNLNILLRDQDGLVATNKNLRLSIVRPDTKVVWDETLKAFDTTLGYYLQRFDLAGDAPEGKWRAELRLDNEPDAVEVFEFKVARYQPERMSLALSVGKPLLTRDDKQVVSLKGAYAYGAPAAKHQIIAARSLQLEPQPLGEAFKDYTFGVPEDIERLETIKLPDLSLDEQGNGFLEFPAVVASIQSPLKTTISASLLELGGHSVTRELQQAYWPTQHLIGIKPLFANARVAANSEAHFDIVRVDPTGNLLAAQRLTATLFTESYDYYWEYVAEQGWQPRGIPNQYPVLQQMVDIPAGQHGQLLLSVQEGRYRLELEDADTKLKTAYVFTAGWQNAVNFPTEPNDLVLSLDKTVYKAAETAKLSIDLPMKSEVLVTVEGGQLLWSKQLSLPAGVSVVDIPIQEAWQRHDLYLAVNALTADSAQQGSLQRHFGIIPLMLDRSERRLELSIETSELVTAEQTVKVVVKAANLKSTAALVSLSAVDTQLLNPAPLTTDNDPYSFYFSAHAYDVRLYDDYDQIISDAEPVNFVPAELNKPSTGPTVVQHLGQKLTALITEPVVFDAEGRAEILLNLPPFTGNLQLTATAFSDEQLGSASKQIQVVSPIDLSLSLPQFLATDDQAFLKVAVKNRSDREQILKLKVTSNTVLEGLALDKELSLAVGQAEQLNLPISTLSSLGLGQINLELAGKDFSLKREFAIPVRPAYARIINYQQQELVGLGKTAELNAPAQTEYLPNTAETCLSISNSLPLPVAAILRSLLHYPYDSLEQTVSSTYPYLFLDEAAVQKWDLPALSLAQRTQRIQEALGRLRSMQLPSGGFTSWAKLGAEEYGLNAYVTSFLLDAQQQGFAVPTSLLEPALANLQQSWQQETPQLEERYPLAENALQMDLAVRAYSAYVLAKAHKLTLNALRAFTDKAVNQMELGLPLVQLGLALTLQGDATRGDELIQRGLSLPRKADLYLGDYGSVLRDRTMMLYQLLLAEQTVPALSVHLGDILHDIHENKYLSTQEQALVFLLGQLLEKQAKAPWQAQWVVEGKTIDLDQSGSFNRCLPSFAVGSQVLTKNDNALYFSLTTQAYPKEMPAATEKPIRLQRKWYDLSGKELAAADLKIGDLVLTRLNIESTEPIPHALVVDLLPAGFELELGDLQANEVLQALKLEDMAVSVAETMAYSANVHESFWPDRYVANLALKAKANRSLFYLVRIAQAAQATVPQAYVVDLDRPFIQGLGQSSELLQTK